ncbi:hypothetical protein H7F15_16075 [Pontibacter sp. Tf4]|uniref:hypothetical protein n=1 Tax=Pontibacter sp. Tf4 TaxID=2761620 RepID=UPI0016280B40|nr:hypothetical protein [Pontibacter sp. Tf4]MBB6612562.1 hypothetical protein [Pontibacter sp. Tf4]
MDEFDFEFGPAALPLPTETQGNKGADLLWLLVILGVVVVGVMLYLLLQERRPPRQKRLLPEL